MRCRSVRFLFACAIAVLCVLWLVLCFPLFWVTEQASFFCFLREFHIEILSTEGPARWWARFCIQFWHWGVGAVVVHLLLLGLWLAELYFLFLRRGLRISGLIATALLAPLYFVLAYRGVEGLAWVLRLMALLAVAIGLKALWCRPALDTKKTLPPWALLLLLPTLGVGAFSPLFNHAFGVQRTFYKSERAAEAQDWESVYRLAGRYFDAHPEEKVLSQEKAEYRDLLSVNLKLALLQTRRLNREFFSFGRVPEMWAMFPHVNSAAGRYNLPNIRLAWHVGLMIPMRIYANNHLNTHGLNNAAVNWIIPNSIYLGRYDLARRYLYYQAHTLAYRNEARFWQAYNSPEASSAHPYISHHRESGNARTIEEDVFLDFWVEKIYTPLSDTLLLDYKTFTDLYYLHWENLPAAATHYGRLGLPLPEYLQEGLFLASAYKPGEVSAEVLRECRRVEEACRLFQRGELSYKELWASCGSSYILYYYISTGLL